ncbi:MAG: hypothetical protein LDLANPLL_00466 [Turneriella sp.]|nr:hypothetical protein [Turneriella sp.]
MKFSILIISLIVAICAFGCASQSGYYADRYLITKDSANGAIGYFDDSLVIKTGDGSYHDNYRPLKGFLYYTYYRNNAYGDQLCESEIAANQKCLFYDDMQNSEYIGYGTLKFKRYRISLTENERTLLNQAYSGSMSAGETMLYVVGYPALLAGWMPSAFSSNPDIPIIIAIPTAGLALILSGYYFFQVPRVRNMVYFEEQFIDSYNNRNGYKVHHEANMPNTNMMAASFTVKF